MTRGRKPSGAYSGQTAVFSTRMTPELRRKVERSAKSRKHSLTQEVEKRLRDSFEADKKIEELYGDRRTFAFVRLLSLATDTWWSDEEGTPRRHWLDDQFRYDQVTTAITGILRMLRPERKPGQKKQSISGSAGGLTAKTLGGFTAGDVLFEVLSADPNGWEVESQIRDDLAALLDRIPRDKKTFYRKLEEKMK